MSTTFCAQCNAVNLIGDKYCFKCGSDLAVQPTYAASAAPAPWTDAESREWQPHADPLTPLTDVASFSVRHVLDLTLRNFGTHLWPITKLVFLVVTPFEIFKLLSLSRAPQDWQTISLTFLLGVTCNLLIAPALMYSIMKTLETDVAPGVNESFRWGLTKIGRLTVCAAISWVLQALGYMFFVIPGIIVSLSLALVYPVAILEKGSPSDVLRRSRQLTKGYRGDILGAEIVLGLLTLVINGPISLLVADMNSVSLSVFAAVVNDITVQAFTVLSLIMYLTLLRTPRKGNSLLSLTN